MKLEDREITKKGMDNAIKEVAVIIGGSDGKDFLNESREEQESFVLFGLALGGQLKADLYEK